ncbi:MAG: ATP-dependent RecD-like DNA helicase [Acholeplasmatales bacterium]|nr:ATP-dependent RecD-like DNA helicase [Acholeplasmatales bacterium]
MDNELKSYQGIITNYKYESKDSLYKVCTLKLADDSTMTIVGNFPHLEDGLSYEFVGRIKENKYGTQLYVESYSKIKEFSEDGIIAYLSSDKFYGIGPKIAKAIVDKLGLDAIDKILNDNSVLDNISGLNTTKKEILVKTLLSNLELERVYVKLFGFGLTHKMVEKLIEIYGLNAPNIIEENPYILITDVEGFGFLKCDKLAISLGFKHDDIRRLKAAILYTLDTECNSLGYTYLFRPQLVLKVQKLLSDISLIKIEDSLTSLLNDNTIILENERIYIKYLYNAEERLAKKIIDLKNTDIKLHKKEDIIDALYEVEDILNIKYTDQQKDAIINAHLNKLSIITGGPGTGKSTILKGILYVYLRLNNLTSSDDTSFDILLASPTGRAAKRMMDATGFKSSTIHKALGYNRESLFLYNENNILPQNLIIIDEVSMLDVNLADSLFRAIGNNSQVILVGDSNQLPSVGPGNILYDLISSRTFKVTVLTQIMRQALDSNIIKLSSMVLSENIDYKIFNERNEAYFYVSETKDTMDLLFRILDKFIASGGNLNNDIQILIPMYAGIMGIDEVNRKIQERYNKSEEFLIREDKLFKVGDKVLQLKNDNDLDIMNGDIGEVIDILKEDGYEYLMIRFENRIIKYPSSNFDSLSLAYAISIHKSQGSEFENVIMPILPSYFVMLKKRLIYTAITRAKKKIIILGQQNSLNQSIKKGDDLRQTSLNIKIQNLLNSSESNRINDPEIPFEYLGEYDMEGITPYTFMDN